MKTGIRVVLTPLLVAAGTLAFAPFARAKSIDQMLKEARAKSKTIAEEIAEARAKKKTIDQEIEEKRKQGGVKDLLEKAMKKTNDLKPTSGGGLDEMMKKAMGKKDDLSAKSKGPSLEDMASGKVKAHHDKMRAKAEEGFFGKRGMFGKIVNKGFDILTKSKTKKGRIELLREAKEWYKKTYGKKSDDEPEETLLDKWKKQQAGKGPGVFEMMDAARKKKVDAPPPKKGKSLEEMLKEKMGGN